MIKEADWQLGPEGLMKLSDADLITSIMSFPAILLQVLANSEKLVDRVAKIINKRDPVIQWLRDPKNKVEVPLAAPVKWDKLQQYIKALPAAKRQYDWVPCIAELYEGKIPPEVKKLIQEGDLIIYEKKDPYLIRWNGTAWVTIAQWE